MHILQDWIIGKKNMARAFTAIEMFAFEFRPCPRHVPLNLISSLSSQPIWEVARPPCSKPFGCAGPACSPHPS